MSNEPHYARYSLAELLEVKENIDRDKFPNRAEKVDAEIQKRLDAGEKPEQFETQDDEVDEESSEAFILDFQGAERQTFRKFFLGSVVLLHLLLAGFISHKLHIPEIDSLPQYLINVETTRCQKMGSREYPYYDFVVHSWGHQFYAVDIKGQLCMRLQRDIPKDADLKIWHDNGVIFHMTLNDKVLLSQQYLRSNYRGNRLEQLKAWWMLPLLFWVLMFKSVVNAIRPGTFTKE
ncbi:hypothetical protein [Planctobacterium marinum]|uniref:hypothetical protein n=1 Tax=Planctobacterium marinum TaxID=1631968 RepID=UPI001E551249|nr:hypothetical protein [Planctobacterium marinum]MCC2606405.1 hypothetical protein [Planctobacterium marinum]